MGNTVKTAALLGVLSGLLLIAGQAVGGQLGLVIAFALAAMMNLGAYWFSDRMILAMYRAQPVDPGHRLSRIVTALASRAGLPSPKVYVIPTDAPNAFATGRNPQHAAVAATEGILRTLNDEELAGVMAHELAHVRNRDTLISAVAATLAAAIMMLAAFARWGAIFGIGGRGNDRGSGSNLVVLLATAIVAPIAAALIQAAISRSREFAADRAGAEIAGRPDGLASALGKIQAAARSRPLPANPATAHLFIIQPLASGGIATLFSTHPPTEQRIARLLNR